MFLTRTTNQKHWSLLSVLASEAFFPIDTSPDGAHEKKAEDLTAEAAGDQSEEGATGGADKKNNTANTIRALLLNGGMDTEGEIFDDTLVFLVHWNRV